MVPLTPGLPHLVLVGIPPPDAHELTQDVFVRLCLTDKKGEQVQALQQRELVRIEFIDIGLTMVKPEAGDLEAILIAHDELVVVVPAGHAFAGRPFVRLRDVATQTLIAHHEPSPDRTRVVGLLEGCGVSHRIALGVPTLDALKRAIEAGMGITVMPRRCVSNELQQRRLVAIPLDVETSTREIWLVVRNRASMSNTVAEFSQLVHQGCDLRRPVPLWRGAWV